MASKSNSLEYLVSEYVKYPITDTNIAKECEVKFGTKKNTLKISRYNFENVISKLKNHGFSLHNSSSNILRISLDDADKSIENVRIEVNGEHVIQDFCRNENLLNLFEKYNEYINIIKKYDAKKNNQTYKPYDNDDFGFRMAFKLEENIQNDDIIIQKNLLQNFTNLSKYYRYINRSEFTNPEYPFKCHLSIVKNSKTYSQSLKRSGVLSSNHHYEIEIELNDDIQEDNISDVTKKLKILIKHVLSGLQETKYPISYKEIKTKLNEYIQLFNIETSVETIGPQNFIGYSSKTLKLIHVQENTFGNDVNIRNNYTVTEKADGTRKLLYIDGRGTIYMIDTQLHIQYTGMHTAVKDIFNTILDGEHIKYDKQKKYINLFAAFDIYILNNIDKREELFITFNKEGKKIGRLALLEKVIKSIKMTPGVNIPRDAFSIECKKFYHLEGNNIFHNCAIILQKQKDNLFKYNIDGLIFTPSNKPIPINNKRFTWDESFKWKPPLYNTIDFLVKYHKKNGIEQTYYTTNNSYKILHLYSGFSGGYIDPLNELLNYNSTIYKSEKEKQKIKREKDTYKPVLFIPTSPYDEKGYVCHIEMRVDSSGLDNILTDEDNEIIYDNTIIEFAYDTNETREHFQWKPLRIRHDKTEQLRSGHNNFGNPYFVANDNWNSIHNPITYDMITSGINIPEDVDDDVYYNRKINTNLTRGLRDFHNLVVKKLLIKTVAKRDDTLMDFAVGKGGDLQKWINSDLSFVYGIDISRDNIENKKDGACSRYLNIAHRNNTIPDVLFSTGDSGKNIRSGDALEDDKYRVINDAVFGKGPRDKLKMGHNLFTNYGKGKDGFQITSCQFALHYFFKSKYTLENFISNVIECTKLNGYFIGTSYDGNILFDMLSKYDKGESKILRDKDDRIMWEITKQYDRAEFTNDGSCIGYPIDVYQESINKTFTEFLVNYTYFNDLMNMYGFILVPDDEIKSMGLSSSSSLFSELFNIIKGDFKNYSKIGETLKMSDSEKEISFLNRYFIYKKIRNFNGEVKILTNDDEDTYDIPVDIINNDKLPMTKKEFILNKLSPNELEQWNNYDDIRKDNMLAYYSNLDKYKPPDDLEGDIPLPHSPDYPPPITK